MSAATPTFDLSQQWKSLQFAHAVSDVRLIETHISWVVLTGQWAYKFKKPVRFDFLDYSTLERRRHFCELELQRNRSWAAEIYQGLAAVVTEGSGYRVRPWPGVLEPGETVVEYAVRMREFPQSALLATGLQAGAIDLDLIERLAERLAALQRDLAVIHGPDAAAIANVVEPARENFDFMFSRVPTGEARAELESLAAWTEREIGDLTELFTARNRQGFVRSGHGDLHLNNVLYWQQQFLLFDGIEFNPQLSEIDTINDIAFLQMELSEHGYRPHARRFLNRYLEASGDYAGLGVLRFYLVYRAMVRAKVDLIRARQTHAAAAPPSGFSEEGRRYVRYARDLIAPRPVQMAITFGLSGSGKSTRARHWVDRAGFLRLRSDVVRKELAGRDPFAKSAAGDLPQLYNQASTAATYQRLAERVEQIVRAGYSVIVDATFLRKEQRQAFRRLAERLQVEFAIVACTAPPDELERRLRARGADPSDANASVLHQQMTSVDPLEEDELPAVAPDPE